MARKKKQYTLEELNAQIEAAKTRRQDAEARALNARKAEADAIRQREALIAQERLRRTNVLIEKLSELGYPMDTDSDVEKIAKKIRRSGGAGYSDFQIRVLASLRDFLEEETQMRLKAEEDISDLREILTAERELREGRASIGSLIREDVKLRHEQSKQQPRQKKTSSADK